MIHSFCNSQCKNEASFKFLLDIPNWIQKDFMKFTIYDTYICFIYLYWPCCLTVGVLKYKFCKYEIFSEVKKDKTDNVGLVNKLYDSLIKMEGWYLGLQGNLKLINTPLKYIEMIYQCSLSSMNGKGSNLEKCISWNKCESYSFPMNHEDNWLQKLFLPFF